MIADEAILVFVWVEHMLAVVTLDFAARTRRVINVLIGAAGMKVPAH
jgi:2-keto-3-deoxy-L-rhamnonate aldolase RhmA